jgi:hypothetical protein
VSAPTAAGRFVGQSIKRREDPRLLTGHDAYVEGIRRQPLTPSRLLGALIAARPAPGRNREDET